MVCYIFHVVLLFVSVFCLELKWDIMVVSIGCQLSFMYQHFQYWPAWVVFISAWWGHLSQMTTQVINRYKPVDLKHCIYLDSLADSAANMKDTFESIMFK